jgi:transposase-like protein
MEEKIGSKAGKAGSGEVAPKATRRTFTREYKQRIVREAAEASRTGGIGALLRRERLYSSSLAQWRREFEGGGAGLLEPKRRGPKPRFTAEEKANQKLERENERLRKKLAVAEALVDLQEKTFAMLATLEPEKGSGS